MEYSDNIKVSAEYILCTECIWWEDCDNKESREGCYCGERKVEECQQTTI